MMKIQTYNSHKVWPTLARAIVSEQKIKFKQTGKSVLRLVVELLFFNRQSVTQIPWKLPSKPSLSYWPRYEKSPNKPGSQTIHNLQWTVSSADSTQSFKIFYFLFSVVEFLQDHTELNRELNGKLHFPEVLNGLSCLLLIWGNMQPVLYFTVWTQGYIYSIQDLITENEVPVKP